MSVEIAFVGDVHGNLNALRGLSDVLTRIQVQRTIFLGDYINKGPDSAGVLQALLLYAEAGWATLLRGNHESTLLDAIDSGNLTAFLKMGGAMTIRSYVGERVGPDVLKDFRAKFPCRHLDGLRAMSDVFETSDVIAQHIPPAAFTTKFRISAHVPVGELPLINTDSAALDTGCGAALGRLTALLWPSLDYVQVDANGVRVTRN